MTSRLLIAAALLTALRLQGQPDPESCLVKDGRVTVEHASKSYLLATEECRQQFLSDPERYSQLYDALLELRAAGLRQQPPRPSLVPS